VVDTTKNLKPFSETRQPSPSTRSRPRGQYLTPILKKFLNKSIDYEDPDTKKIIHGKVKDAILWRLLLNAAQGDNIAIKEILDRIDGKVFISEQNEGDKKNLNIILVTPKERLDEQRVETLTI
jgi:hypothetical protein